MLKLTSEPGASPSNFENVTCRFSSIYKGIEEVTDPVFENRNERATKGTESFEQGYHCPAFQAPGLAWFPSAGERGADPPTMSLVNV